MRGGFLASPRRYTGKGRFPGVQALIAVAWTWESWIPACGGMTGLRGNDGPAGVGDVRKSPFGQDVRRKGNFILMESSLASPPKNG